MAASMAGSLPLEEEEYVTGLFSLPWEDVLFQCVFPFLSINELFMLRATSTLAHKCVQLYFSCFPVVNITRLGSRFNENTFRIITEYNCSIQRLVLRNCKNWLTDRLLVPVVGANHKLVSLDLTNCTSITNSSMQKVAISCPRLQEIRLRDCHWLSPDSVVVIGMNCHQLRLVDMTGCWEVNDDALIVLVMHAEFLSYLSIAKIYGLTDTSISVLAKTCRNLRHLNMQGCWRVTDDSVRFLGEYCKSLQGLQVRECRDVTEISLARLRAKSIRVDVPIPRRFLPSDITRQMGGLSLQI